MRIPADIHNGLQEGVLIGRRTMVRVDLGLAPDILIGATLGLGPDATSDLTLRIRGSVTEVREIAALLIEAADKVEGVNHA